MDTAVKTQRDLSEQTGLCVKTKDEAASCQG